MVEVSGLISLTEPKLLLGEGKDEVRLFQALLSHLAITDVQCLDYGGKSKLAGFLNTLPTAPGYRDVVSLGVTRDADDSAAGAFSSACAGLRAAGLLEPGAPGVLAAGKPSVCVMILPGTATGALEDLVLASLDDDACMSCVTAFFQCAQTTADHFPTSSESKARLHAWLALQTVPDKRLGEAAQAGMFDWTRPAFSELVSFVQRL